MFTYVRREHFKLFLFFSDNFNLSQKLSINSLGLILYSDRFQSNLSMRISLSLI